MKIRFVKTDEFYYIQRRSFFGWRYMIFWGSVFDRFVYSRFKGRNKHHLLREVLKHLNLREDTTNITEYPMTIKYRADEKQTNKYK